VLRQLLGAIDGPDPALSEDSFRIYQEGAGKGISLIGLLSACLGIYQGNEGIPVSMDILGHLWRLIPEGDEYHGEALLPVPIEQRLEDRHFLFAWVAPGSPKVEQDHLPTQIIKVQWPPFYVW
jgi:hypothetical protein